MTHDLMPKWLQNSSMRQHFGPRGVAKQSFDNQADADQYADELNKRPKASKRKPYHGYQCHICKQWHVGKSLPKKVVKPPQEPVELLVGSARTHQKKRQELRRRLEKQGVPAEEIAMRVEALRTKQEKARKIRKDDQAAYSK